MLWSWKGKIFGSCDLFVIVDGNRVVDGFCCGGWEVEVVRLVIMNFLFCEFLYGKFNGVIFFIYE